MDLSIMWENLWMRGNCTDSIPDVYDLATDRDAAKIRDEYQRTDI